MNRLIAAVELFLSKKEPYPGVGFSWSHEEVEDLERVFKKVRGES